MTEHHGRRGGDERPLMPFSHAEPVEAEFLGQARVAEYLPEPFPGGFLLAGDLVRGVRDQRDGNEPHEAARAGVGTMTSVPGAIGATDTTEGLCLVFR